MRRTSLALVALALVAAHGCGGADEPAAERTARDTADPGPVEVTKVEVGREGGPAPADPYRPLPLEPEDTLVARVETSGAAPATLTAVWKNEAGEVVGESSRSIEPGAGAGVTEFHLSRPAGWSTGEHVLEVWVDGGLVDVRAFEVEAEGRADEAGGRPTP